MSKKSHIHFSDVSGISKLATTATTGITDLAEALHRTISNSPGLKGHPLQKQADAIAGLVYANIRSVTQLVRDVTDLSQFSPLLDEKSSPEREAVLAALNGVIGDHLAATGNPLAIPMQLRCNGQPLTPQRDALTAAFPAPQDKLLVLVHGLCMNDLQWTQKGNGLEQSFTREFGYSTVHLHYNSGLHISVNGRMFADLLESLLEQWPKSVTGIGILAHSMGGLVARSAYFYGTKAGHTWPKRLQKLIFLGTPHHGAPLERMGNLMDAGLALSAYSAPFARLGKVRSAGITDLRYGNLIDEDWQGMDRFERAGDLRHALPLPQDVTSYAIAANLGKKGHGLVGDGIVPVDSALGRHENPALALRIPASRSWIGYGMNHWDLLGHSTVHEKIKTWLSA